MGNQLGRLVLLIGIAIFAAGCSPNSDGLKRVMNLDKANLTWRGDYDNKTHWMHYTGEWAGFGWQYGDGNGRPPADFSKYDQIVVVVDSVSSDTATLFLNVRYTTTSIITSESAPIVNGKSTLHVNLNPEHKSHVLEFFVMSKYPCDMVVKSVVLSTATRYKKEHELKMNNGFIDASEFKGYSDDAMVSFNYYAGGEMTHVSDSGTIEPMNNWGIGIICSSADVIGNNCPGRQIILKKIGEQSFECRFGDLRYMLDYADDDGERGLYWVVWTGGNVTDVHILGATIREAIN